MDLNYEQVAKRAYELFRASDTKAPEWDALPNQHVWFDATRTYIHNPKGRPVDGMEACIVQAIAEAQNVKIVVSVTESGLTVAPALDPETPAEVAAQKAPAKPLAKPTKKK